MPKIALHQVDLIEAQHYGVPIITRCFTKPSTWFEKICSKLREPSQSGLVQHLTEGRTTWAWRARQGCFDLSKEDDGLCILRTPHVHRAFYACHLPCNPIMPAHQQSRNSKEVRSGKRFDSSAIISPGPTREKDRGEEASMRDQHQIFNRPPFSMIWIPQPD